MSYPMQFPDPHLRLSDSERSTAMAALGRALAEGRLDIGEYDKRCQHIARAATRGEILPLFQDIPQNPDGTGSALEKTYSAQEITAAHRSSSNTRLGIMSLTTVGSIALVPLLELVGAPLPGLAVFLIPVVFILLYIMKVGPDSWYTPSPRQIERERIRQIESANAIRNAEERARHKQEQERLRAQRQRIASELTNEAMGFAKRSIDKLRK